MPCRMCQKKVKICQDYVKLIVEPAEGVVLVTVLLSAGYRGEGAGAIPKIPPAHAGPAFGSFSWKPEG
jgi:hypothetical protein